MLGTFLLVMASVFAMNWFGLRISGRVQLILAGMLAALLLVTVIAALPHARLANLHPFAPHGWAGVGAAAAILVWGFAGWEAVSSLSGEYRNPRRDVPRATAIAVVIVGVLYLAVAATSVLVLGPALGSSSAPLADLLAVGMGGPVRAITAIVAVLLTIGAVNAYMAGASRLGRRPGPRQRAAGPDVRHPAPVTDLRHRGRAGRRCSCRSTLHTMMLLVTGCFTLVYVLGTAAALRLLPSRLVPGRAPGWRWSRSSGLLWLTGPPALLSLVLAAGAVAYQGWRSRSARVRLDRPAEVAVVMQTCQQPG